MAPVATQQMPQVRLFRGDAPELVEALIEASKIPIRAKNAIPTLVGRELVPWQPDEALPANATMQAELESGRRQVSSASPRSKCEHKRSAQRARSSNAVGRSGSPRAAESYSRTSSGGQCASFACPALANSPRPEALPKPTANLLNRAGSRSRSPSPGKDDMMHFHAAHMQRFVGLPVAA